jgi:predicted TPR repeat methyltransferase
MPFSSGKGKAAAIKLLRGLKVKSVLDVGAGSGTYRKLANMNDLLPGARWTALEIWEPYIAQFDLKSLYDEVIIGDVRTYENTKYDLVICGDVLEHMTKEEAFAVLDRFSSSYRFVSVPTIHTPQGEYEGNPHERHIEEDWQPNWITDRYKAQAHNEGKITVYLICPTDH